MHIEIKDPNVAAIHTFEPHPHHNPNVVEYDNDASFFHKEPNIGYFQKLKEAFSHYDKTVVFVMCYSYFLQGFRVFFMMSVKDLFKLYLKLDPNYVQFLSSLVILPWSFKILYGLIADNIPIMGSKRKSYIIINGVSSFLALFVLSLDLSQNEIFITALIFVQFLNTAFNDVVVDALMVQQSKKNRDSGSEDLQGLSWGFLALGGIIGSIGAAYFTEYLKPSDSFLISSLFALVLAISGFMISKDAELNYDDDDDKQIENHQPEGFMVNLKRNWKEIKIALRIPLIYRTLLYFIFASITVPSFGDLWYYYQLNIINFSKFTTGILGMIAFISLLVGVLIFIYFYKHDEVRSLLRYSTFIGIFGCFFSLMFALRWNTYLGIGDLTFIICSTTITDTFVQAFTMLPSLVLFAKITPNNIEATVYALLTGVFNFCTGFVSPMMGILINKLFVGVTTENLQEFYKLLIIQICLVPVPLLFLGLIPLKSDMCKSYDAPLCQSHETPKESIKESLKESLIKDHEK